MSFDPERVCAELQHHGIHARVAASHSETAAPDVELDDGLGVVCNARLRLVQDVEGTLHTRGHYTDLAELIDWVKAYQALNR